MTIVTFLGIWGIGVCFALIIRARLRAGEERTIEKYQRNLRK